MRNRVFTLVLAVGCVFSIALLGLRAGALRLPGDHQGYEPAQPIAYSHRLHAGELRIACQYCHSNAASSRHAGIPAASVCMNCHSIVAGPAGAQRAEDEVAIKEGRKPRRLVSAEIDKLYAALGLGADGKPDAARRATPIAWTRVHNLPDFVYFDHRAHVTAGVSCQTCHGPVETMERLRQVSDLSMGWCVNCHRDANRSGIGGKRVNASIDCATCHF
jgi:hypothetical protein